MRKKYAFFFALVGAICFSGSMQYVRAASVFSQFFEGFQQFSDNNAEYLINRAGGSTIVDPDDILLTIFDFQTVEQAGSPTRLFGANGVNQFVGISAVKVASISGSSSTLLPITAADIAAALVAGQISADLATLMSTWAVGTVIAVYDDSTIDFDRNAAFGTDDGDPGQIGADIGIPAGLFAAEETLVKTTVDYTGLTAAPLGSRIGAVDLSVTELFEVGFTGAGGTAGAGEFLSVTGLLSPDLSLARTLPSGTTIGNTLGGLGLTALHIPNVVFNPVDCFNPLTLSISSVDVCFSNQFLAIGNPITTPASFNETPFDLFTNTDAFVNLHIVPEPSSFILMLLGAVGIGFTAWRRRKI